MKTYIGEQTHSTSTAGTDVVANFEESRLAYGDEPHSKPRILIVDDDPNNIRVLEGMLRSEPTELVTARSGAEVLAVFNDQPPDLVLLDVMMPYMNGFEVCQWIKSNPKFRLIPVVMITALATVEDRVRAIEAGADNFLSKPVNAHELTARVRLLLRIYQVHMEKEQMTLERLRFMSGVAHNIRAPMSSLLIGIDILNRAIQEKTEVVSRTLHRLSIHTDYIQALVTEIMDYYKLETGHPNLDCKPCESREIIDNVLAIAAPLAEEKGNSLSIESYSDIALDTDSKIVTQILLNLLTNAIHYSEAGQTVHLNVYNLAEGRYALPEGHYPTLLTLPPTGLVFEVVDEGEGIADADYPQIFKEFERVKKTAANYQAGMGLGLSTAQRMVRLLGGEIWFTSRVGHGSAFAFFIPFLTT